MLLRAERMRREFFRPVGRQAVSWEPPVDILETAFEVLVLVALPGVAAERVEALIDDSDLLIAGVRVFPPELQTAVIHRLELPQGRFERRIRLPAGRYSDVRRSSVDGCLVIKLEKAEVQKSKVKLTVKPKKGDAQQIDVERVLDGQLADMTFTDPPYNVAIDGNVCGLGAVKHREFAFASGEMSQTQFTAFLTDTLGNMAVLDEMGLDEPARERMIGLLEDYARDGTVTVDEGTNSCQITLAADSCFARSTRAVISSPICGVSGAPAQRTTCTVTTTWTTRSAGCGRTGPPVRTSCTRPACARRGWSPSPRAGCGSTAGTG